MCYKLKTLNIYIRSFIVSWIMVSSLLVQLTAAVRSRNVPSELEPTADICRVIPGAKAGLEGLMDIETGSTPGLDPVFDPSLEQPANNRMPNSRMLYVFVSFISLPPELLFLYHYKRTSINYISDVPLWIQLLIKPVVTIYGYSLTTGFYKVLIT